MKLKKLSLSNFRGFDQIDLDFADDVTVIAGVNGIGKSSVLSALTCAMSLALPKLTSSKEAPLGFGDTDVQSGKSGLTLSVTLEFIAAKAIVDVARAAPVAARMATKLLKRRDELRFSTRETEEGSAEEQKVSDQARLLDLKLMPVEDTTSFRLLPEDVAADPGEMAMTFKNARQPPLAVFYSTSRFLSRLPPVLPKTKSIDVATAYDKSLNQLEVSLNDFANWYRVVKKTAAVSARNRLFDQLEKAIQVFLPDVSKLTLHEERPPKFSVLKNKKRLYLDQLSDGERGLLALVFDLVRRLAIANPDSENPITEGTALILIDEVELHLHPSWQRQVLRLLTRTFVKCQFVVTTHSPQVIGQVRPENLRLLHFDKLGKVALLPKAQSFGMDSSWILMNIMGVPARDLDTERRLSEVFELIDQNRLQDARHSAELLRADVGDFPDLQEAIALLDRFALLGSE